MDGLFDIGEPRPATGSGGTLEGNTHASAPLAVRMRPRTLDELVGQQHLLAAGSPLRRLIEEANKLGYDVVMGHEFEFYFLTKEMEPLFGFFGQVIVWSVVKVVFGLRVTEAEEREGLDMSEMGMPAYGRDALLD